MKAKNVAFVGNYLPRECGIATFTTDLCESVAKRTADSGNILAVAMNNIPEGYDYPPRVKFEIRQGHYRDYSVAAGYINHSDVQCVCVQHEYGIFGGDDGVFVLHLMSRLNLPVVVTLHTVLKSPSPNQRKIIEQIGRTCSALVVMSEKAVDFLKMIYSVPAEKIHLIHHGIPEVPFTEGEARKANFRLEGRPVLMTFGLLNPNKGIEVSLKAIARLVEKWPDLAYIVLGATHPELKKQRGEEYRIQLERQIESLGLAENVLFHNRFVDLETLISYLAATDIYLTPYWDEAQIVSGSLAYAMGSGNALVSTPYWYAEEMLADSRGFLFPFGDDQKLHEILDTLLSDKDLLEKTKKASYEFSRRMIWNHVAGEYMELFDQVVTEYKREVSPIPHLHTVAIPNLRLDHLVRLTDGTGMFEHARFVIPKRDEGYCLDDNARALIVTARAYHLTGELLARKLTSTYMGFVQHCQREDGLFHNRLSYERKTTDDVGSDDSIGRAIWALGYLVRRPPLHGHRSTANDCFCRAIPHIPKLSLRGRAYALLGLYAYLKYHDGNENARRILLDTASWIVDQYRANKYEGWHWFEDTLAYDNAMIPFALLRSYRITGEEPFLTVGMESLAFLERICFSSGYLRPVGNQGWYPKGGEAAQYDQQPLEATAFMLAYKEAFRCSGDETHLKQMKRSFGWFLGDNDLGMSLYDYESAGCSDGLHKENISLNQGAESTLSFLLALLSTMETSTIEHK